MVASSAQILTGMLMSVFGSLIDGTAAHGHSSIRLQHNGINARYFATQSPHCVCKGLRSGISAGSALLLQTRARL